MSGSGGWPTPYTQAQDGMADGYRSGGGVGGGDRQGTAAYEYDHMARANNYGYATPQHHNMIPGHQQHHPYNAMPAGGVWEGSNTAGFSAPQQSNSADSFHSSHSSYGYGGQHVMNPYGDHVGAPHNYNTAGYGPGHPGQHMAYPGPPGGFQMNVNAPSFTPRGQQNQMQQNRYDMYGPAYAGAPMYGMSGYQEPNYYQNHVQSCPPSMTQCYGESAPDDYGYEQMYSLAAQQYIPSQKLQQQIVQCGQPAIIAEIQVGLEQLMSESDEFESWAGAIKDRMADRRMTKEARETAMSIAAEMAVAGSPDNFMASNPQYSIARLIAYLCKEQPAWLGECVLPVLERFHDERSQMDDEPRAHLLLFFAEVYEKLEMANGSHITPVGVALMEQAEESIKNHQKITDAQVKRVIQVFKLCGRHLDPSEVLRKQVDDVLTRCSAYAKGHPQLSESIKTQLTALIELRERGWGVNDKCVATSSAGAILCADGRPLSLTEEERNFLESHFGTLDDDNDLDAGGADEEEMMNNYEQYLRQENADRKAGETAKLMEKLSVVDEKQEGEGGRKE